MTEGIQIALISASVPTIVGLCSFIVLFRKSGEHGDKLDHIVISTNSTLAAAMARILELEKDVARQKDVQAQAARLDIVENQTKRVAFLENQVAELIKLVSAKLPNQFTIQAIGKTIESPSLVKTKDSA